tara:strand:+ start:1575 stop:1742 length:168 start_codon:yes stop_codon:yes gene_type:complete
MKSIEDYFNHSSKNLKVSNNMTEEYLSLEIYSLALLIPSGFKQFIGIFIQTMNLK